MVNKKCPPNTFCFSWEFALLVIILVIIIWAIIPKEQPQVIKEFVPIIKERPIERHNIFMDPYVPPQKLNPYIQNVAYSQVGILTDKHNNILGLFGKPHDTSRNKWSYYTMSDRNVSVKLPVIRNGKSCTGDYGCDEIINAETVYVHGYNDVFNVLIYDNATPRYNPFI